MRFTSEYLSDDELKSAKVYWADTDKPEKRYIVIVKDDTGTHYQATFASLQQAENYAEDWTQK